MAYLKQEFMDYLHKKGNANPGAYCNGLDNVEKILFVDIDAEYAKDECKYIYAQLQDLRKHPEKVGKAEHVVRQYASRLQKYIEFRAWKQTAPDITPTDFDETTGWIPFYMELADKLSLYKSNRDELLAKLKHLFATLGMKNPFVEKDVPMSDIDPFTVFGCFNKGITTANRNKILQGFKAEFDIEADVPTNFDGIPVLNNLMAVFFAFKDDPRRGEHDIENLWNLYISALDLADNWSSDREKQFVDCFDTARKQFGVRWNITMALFWIRPYDFINLDDRNRQYLAMGKTFPPVDSAIASQLKNVPSGAKYLEIIKELKRVIEQYGASVNINSFIDLSHQAWLATTGEKVKQTATTEYWPSIEEYNPNLTKEEWKRYIEEIELPNHPSPMEMLKGIMMLGGEATCAKLSKVYGGHPSRYVGCAVNLGKRAKKYFDLPPCMDKDQERFFPIPFLGRYVKEDGVNVYSYLIRPELQEALKEIDLSAIDPYNPAGYDNTETPVPETTTDVPLNTILYGPPGTGKTYYTAIYAVAIVEGKELAIVENEAKINYDAVFERYNDYKSQGLIEFITFHQSYGYEEFIEGIRPVIVDDEDGENSGNIQYSIQSGVFKKFCTSAYTPALTHSNVDDLGINPNSVVWKVSLEGTGDNPTRTECLKNNHIRIGWDEYGKDITDETDFSQHGGRVVLNAFINKMQIGDIVLSCYSASTIDAIGVVTGEYEWHNEYNYYRRVRKVNWLVKDIRENILILNNGKPMTLASVYKMSSITIADVCNLLEKYHITQPSHAPQVKNHVFIIDEINRGNISKIFGELITLIEPSKRIGAAEELTSVLPYSQQAFGVPNNVYIIGTMNTADRSIAVIDTALRRRFQFREMMPDADVLAGITVEGVSIPDMLTSMNKRIEVLYDREHTIGHAYFMPLKDSPTIETLASIFSDRIIPLLQEYFYEDYEKIRLVLGDNRKSDDSITFITKKQNSYAELFGTMDLDLDEGYTYEINKAAFSSIDSYKTI